MEHLDTFEVMSAEHGNTLGYVYARAIDEAFDKAARQHKQQIAVIRIRNGHKTELAEAC